MLLVVIAATSVYGGGGWSGVAIATGTEWFNLDDDAREDVELELMLPFQEWIPSPWTCCCCFLTSDVVDREVAIGGKTSPAGVNRFGLPSTPRRNASCWFSTKGTLGEAGEDETNGPRCRCELGVASPDEVRRCSGTQGVIGEEKEESVEFAPEDPPRALDEDEPRRNWGRGGGLWVAEEGPARVVVGSSSSDEEV